jgi:hypothetical protein
MLKLWEVTCINMYVFDGGGIVKLRIKAIHEGSNLSYSQSLLISGWTVTG